MENAGSSGGSPGTRPGRRSSLALTPEDEPLDVASRLPPPTAPPALLYAPPEHLDLVYACGERGSRAAHVLVVDARQPHLVDALQLGRSVRAMKGTHHLFLVAVVKKNTYLKDDFAILPFIEAGFNRVMVETTVIAAWCAELVQARAAAASMRASLAAVAALAAAIDRCRDLVAITDETQKILFTSRSWRTTLGWRGEETGHPLGEMAAGEALRAGAREWEAPLALRRRTTPDTLLVPCKGAAVAVAKSTSHLVFVCPALGAEGGPRGSLHSVRRGSLDIRSIASDGLRRTSLAKLQGLPLEAPITKVISLLSAATEGATPQTVANVERAVDILRTTELYSPQMRDDRSIRTEDPIATDLIGALLSQGPTNVLSSRRSSNDSTVVRAAIIRQNMKHKNSTQLQELLNTSLSWDFEIFKLEELTRSRPLSHLGQAIMVQRFDACSVLECDERTLHNWLTVIEMNYHTINTYHNSTHAADVLQSVAYFLEKDRLKYLLEPLEAAAALLAAAAHDVDHPGTSSAFLCNARHPLAILYNDLAVLESHHAALTFKLTMNDDRVNIFKNLDRETYKMVRHNIVDMILATEMTKHFEHLAKFVNVFYAKNAGSREDDMQIEVPPDHIYQEPLSLDTSALLLPENIVLVKRMMIKCADVSNASRPAKFALEWARRIAEEYFLQTDEEKSRDLPVVMPMFDRASCSIPRSQIGFIDYIIIDMMEAWAAFIDMPELVSHARQNYTRWREMDEQGVTTLQDLRRAQLALQRSLSTAPPNPASTAE